MILHQRCVQPPDEQEPFRHPRARRYLPEWSRDCRRAALVSPSQGHRASGREKKIIFKLSWNSFAPGTFYLLKVCWDVSANASQLYPCDQKALYSFLPFLPEETQEKTTVRIFVLASAGNGSSPVPAILLAMWPEQVVWMLRGSLHLHDSNYPCKAVLKTKTWYYI